uniref:SECIS binding protein 2 n=1 Tax=Chelonoidis abingdonii TaxID=106734 RepID=A0A8C0H986_CHEAB
KICFFPKSPEIGFKFSADVKPFVPKYTTVTVAWSEPSEACVFPTAYYSRIQEQPQICAEDVSWDGASSLSQYISGSIMGYTPLGEYSSSPPSSDAVPNMCSLASARYNYNNSLHYNHSRIVNECGEQICPVRQETRKTPKVNRSNKAMNRKSKLIPKNESLPKPAFEVTLSDFPKLQTLGSNDVVDLQKHKWGPLCSTEGNTALLRQPVRTQTSALVTTESKTRNGASETEPEEVSEKKKKKKKKKPKSNPEEEKPQNESFIVQEPPRIEEASKSSGKKSQIPVKLDLGGMLAVLEQKQHAEKSKQSSKPVVLSVGGAIPLLSKEPTTVTKNQQLNQGKTPHNPLDSSAPLVKKGKQREVPKAKKPTSLKKIILKEREQRKQHLLEQTTIPKDDGDTVHQCEESTTEDQTLTQDTKTEYLTLEQLLIFFSSYCSQVLSKEVDSCVTDLLKELVRFQDRLYQKDPVKAKTKRRLVMGLREVLKHLKLKKLKCVIISPNCEKIQSKGGLDETLHTIIDCACEQNIPFVFALNRKALGRCVNKAVPVSVVGIFSYDGAQDHFHKMVELTMEARHAYKDMVAALEEEVAEGGGSEKHSTILTSQYEKKSLSKTSKTPHVESDEDVPNYSECSVVYSVCSISFPSLVLKFFSDQNLSEAVQSKAVWLARANTSLWPVTLSDFMN